MRTLYLRGGGPVGNVAALTHEGHSYNPLRMLEERPQAAQPARFHSLDEDLRPSSRTPSWATALPEGRRVVCAQAEVFADDPTYTSDVVLDAAIFTGPFDKPVQRAVALPQGEDAIVLTTSTTRIVTTSFPALDIAGGQTLTVAFATPTTGGHIAYNAQFQDSLLRIVTAPEGT